MGLEMNLHLKTAAMFFSLGGLLGLLGAQAETYTYPQLVQRITDLEHLAQIPPEGEKTALASSYDRRSQYDATNDKYLDWSANFDGDGVVRKEGDNVVMAEMQGPGCIWRTWSAEVHEGHVKIYLDGDEKPAVDLAWKDYFDNKSGPFTWPNLAYNTTAKGYDNYVPIPFQKSCKIVAEKGWGLYFHFNYTLFPPDTVVPTFKLPFSSDDAAALDQANAALGKCGEDPAGDRANQKSEKNTVTIEAGKSATIADLTGPEAITALRCQVDGVPTNIDDQTTFFRQLAVHITWDDQDSPAVWSPLGDFFADAAGPAPYLSLPMGIKDGQFYSYWYMPFASHAVIAVDNDSDKTVTMTWEVVHAPLTTPIASLLRFHAKWHRDAFLPTRADRAIDWTLLTTEGKGRYVGTQLHVWNPKSGWWGEGDEKFFIDGEKFPSTFGTGSEDYFGFAWSTGHPFNEPLHGQPVNEFNSGHVSVHRWHIPDSVPFQTSFEGDIEKYFSNQRPTIFAAVAYWYLSPDGKDNYTAQPVADRIGYWDRAEAHLERGAIEGESLKVLSQQPDSSTEVDDLSRYFLTGVWSNDAQILWKAKAEGQKLELELPVTADGNYQVILHFTKAPDYGIFQAALDDTNMGDPVDLYGKPVGASGPIDMGAHNLTAGNHTLSFVVTGKNTSSTNYSFGLDYIMLKPAK